MTKEEFEQHIGEEVTPDQYEKIEEVYMWHPTIEDKDDIATIYKVGGMRVILDMLPTAQKAETINRKQAELRAELVRLNREYKALEKGEDNDGSDHED